MNMANPLGSSHLWCFSPQNHITISRQIDIHFITENSVFHCLVTVQRTLLLYQFFCKFSVDLTNLHAPPNNWLSRSLHILQIETAIDLF